MRMMVTLCSSSLDTLKNTAKFRTSGEIGFFDRVSYFRNANPLYKWIVDDSSITQEPKAMSFLLTRDYTESVKDIVRDQLSSIETSIRVTIAILPNGFVNILAEDPDHQRFRVRDVPGVVEPHIFQSPKYGGTSDAKYTNGVDSISMKFNTEISQIVGYTNHDAVQSQSSVEVTVNKDSFSLCYTVNGQQRLVIPANTFVFETSKDAELIRILAENSGADEWLQKVLKSTSESYKFKGYTEQIPHGPSCVGLTLEHVKHVDSSFDLKLMGLCHRLTDNLDFECSIDYESRERLTEPHRSSNNTHFSDKHLTVGLYGSCPLLYSLESNISTGVIVLNTSDTLVDFMQNGDNKISEWTNESGVLDLYMFTSESIEQNAQKVSEFSGRIPMPLETALGHHQCRWNYFTQFEVEDLNQKLVEHNVPTDFIWLDIEHTNSKVYFTWDKEAFPNPKAMYDALVEADRQLVTIVDPHFKDYRFAEADEKRKTEALKRIQYSNETTEKLTEEEKLSMETLDEEAANHYLAPEAISKGLVVMDNKGKEFNGFCWPGTCVWIDFLNHEAQQYFGNQYLHSDHLQRLPHVHVWNDMNEPEVFLSETEASMPKTNIHKVTCCILNNEEHTYEIKNFEFEHRDVHSLYALTNQKATYEGLSHKKIELDGQHKHLRPFSLSRSYFMGSQKYCAMWLGDSTCSWEHLAKYIQMCASIALSGFSFCGPDIPGFWGNATPELCTRAYQLGCLFPFFRSHSDRLNDRREVYLFDSPYKQAMTNAIVTRYELIPYYYTQFYHHHISSLPIINLVIDYESGEIHRDQLFIGQTLITKAVTQEEAKTVSVYLPEYETGDFWYQRHCSEVYSSKSLVEVEVEISEQAQVPIFVKGGSIVPEHFNIQQNEVRSLWEMRKTGVSQVKLYIYPDENHKAKGYLYEDDGFSTDYTHQKYNLIIFSYSCVNSKDKLRVKYLNRGYDRKTSFIARVITKDKEVSFEMDEEELDIKM
ncbi:unnamed protein product [Moneuplotes crassus]|uniref:Glycoside hydrolase family 31 N-terminal domain-containing protein n=1 Tax=Euplotes crassus TaxID=5936 RepID=A0AAD1XX90_EUPCR|nr:unnamed protein product [Moneuplotes crassus]